MNQDKEFGGITFACSRWSTLNNHIVRGWMPIGALEFSNHALAPLLIAGDKTWTVSYWVSRHRAEILLGGRKPPRFSTAEEAIQWCHMVHATEGV